jgi:catechol 2,3-dioxygenase-like lactoylglutathione lyase family enzyme
VRSGDVPALRVLHPVITVSDLDAALVFYCDLLGLVVASDFVHDPELLAPLVGVENPDVRAAILRCPDGSELELAEFRSPRGRATCEKAFADAGITFVTLVVDDIEETVVRLEEAGYAMHGPIVDYPSEEGMIRVVYCYGPDRTGITLAELPS